MLYGVVFYQTTNHIILLYYNLPSFYRQKISKTFKINCLNIGGISVSRVVTHNVTHARTKIGALRMNGSPELVILLKNYLKK